MKKTCLGSILCLLVGGALPALVYAQGEDENPPIIQSLTLEIARNQGESFWLGPFDAYVPFDPNTEIAAEGDLIRWTLVVSDGDLPDEEIWVRKQSLFLWFYWYDWTYSSFAPEPPPVEGDSFKFRGPYGDVASPMTLRFAFQVPEWVGPNQDRLRGLIDYDVQWYVTIQVANSEDPGEEDPVDTVAFVLSAVENPGLRPPNPPPFADAGADQTVAAGSTVQLDGARTFDAINVGFDPLDPDVLEKDTLTYVWEWVSGPQPVDPQYPDPESQPWLAEVTLDVIGTYVYRLFVTDGVNPTPNSATVTIEVVAYIPVNRAPRAVIDGPDEPVVEGAIITLDASDSSDPDGDDLYYRWAQIDEVGGLIPFEDLTEVFQPLGGLEEVESSWQAIRPGTYYFLLIVNDGKLSDTATITVEVIDAESAGVAAGEGSDDPAGLAPGAGFLPGVAGCGGSLLPLALLPLLFWPLRGRMR